MAQWNRIENRGNVEDRRSMVPVALGSGIGVGGIVLVLALNFLFGGDLNSALYQIQNLPTQQQSSVDSSRFEGSDEYEVFASTVLGSNNEMWEMKFKELGFSYESPKLVLFRTATQSGCGVATSDTGPHYCPADETIYLDETFFEELTSRFGAQGGDVAEAYVISHEVGHHVQNQLGTINNAGNSNQDSVNLELQADCFAGLWANSIKDLNVFAPGEIIEAIDAAAAVGDDRIQSKSTGQINPETWTHGSSEQRVGSFNKGFESGEFSSCNTFN